MRRWNRQQNGRCPALRVAGIVVALLVAAVTTVAQKAELRPAAPVAMPGATDSNSPAHWHEGTLFLFNSAGNPVRSSGPDQFHLGSALAVGFNHHERATRWIEATWADADGTVYAWYHHEPAGLCPGTTLTAPKIGALRTRKNSSQFEDLGVILEATELDCTMQNGYFAGGHGDFSVILDRSKSHFYFLISTYEGEAGEQGVAVARMAFADRDNPVGKVFKYRDGAWDSPGLGGKVTPVFPARISWKGKDADAFWGPSVHWNTFLNLYVMLLNRTCCATGWPQEGVYVSFNSDAGKPSGWSQPVKILDGAKKGFRGEQWYPQVLGLDVKAQETDKLAGRVARFYLAGKSKWEIVFSR